MTASAQAGQVYGGVGLPGFQAGYAQPFSRTITLRGDVSTLRLPSRSANKSGIAYQISPSLNRLGMFADWFALQGGLRLTGGITFNQMNLTLHAQGNGDVINIGGTEFTISPDDQLDVKIEFPRVTPYLGLGYGHHVGNGGLGLTFDLGASIGRARLRAGTAGPNLGRIDQESLNRELEELSDALGKQLRVIPQVSLGLTYRF